MQTPAIPACLASLVDYLHGLESRAATRAAIRARRRLDHAIKHDTPNTIRGSGEVQVGYGAVHDANGRII